MARLSSCLTIGRSTSLLAVVLVFLLDTPASYARFFGAAPLRGSDKFDGKQVDVAKATVFLRNSSTVKGGEAGWDIVDGILDFEGLAVGSFQDLSNTTGWGRLYLSATPEAAEHGHYALGLLEGYLTCRYLSIFMKNYHEDMFPSGKPNKQLLEFVRENDEWVRAKAAEKRQEDEYWQAVQGVLDQFDGMLEGVARGCPDLVHSGAVSYERLLLLNLNGDLFDLKEKFPEPKGSLGAEVDDAASEAAVNRRGEPRPAHCSALIKLAPDFSDVYAAHTTWDTYANAAPRIYKDIVVGVRRGGAEGTWEESRAVFSSSPGFISSIDDFYTVSGTANLTVIETSNNVYNKSLYERVTAQSVPCYMRAVVANRLATDGSEWAKVFGRHHSGTYNDQWMVLDLNRFTPGSPPEAGLLTVLEEVPGYVHSADMTETLAAELYWGSYNCPYFKEVRALSGYDEMEAKHGSAYSHSECPRAQLFKELQASAVSVEGMQAVISWNDFQHNSISGDSPTRAIAARGDLWGSAQNTRNLTSRRTASGGIDGKVSSYTSFMAGQVAYARAGPTHSKQPVFCWEADDPQIDKTPHWSHPACFPYRFEEMRRADEW
eukprot:CAMPEP_0118943100 /NCGR_PEP_ID=MMETSP1169-20130426/37522_1 /TAXON_ID=36882 /ORGANISM="Pyramimonas obovata, Strain CCMP722" /LENGTH=601 /DNA_ID=CAMNT_0006888257 /DNA_START=125 /DNA_END=1927 /DNA_ORIENTATION=-